MKRLTKDMKNEYLTGVCSGIGKYLNIDPIFIIGNTAYCDCCLENRGSAWKPFWNGRKLPDNCTMKLEYIVLTEENKGD